MKVYLGLNAVRTPTHSLTSLQCCYHCPTFFSVCFSFSSEDPRSKSRYQYHSFIGVPGNGPCGFHQPCGAATTSDGFLYLVDSGNNRIKVYKLDPEDGRARYIYVGEYGGHKSHLDNPCGIIIDEARSK